MKNCQKVLKIGETAVLVIEFLNFDQNMYSKVAYFRQTLKNGSFSEKKNPRKPS